MKIKRFKEKKWLIILLIFIATGAGLWAWMEMKHHGHEKSNLKSESKKAPRYQCPMHPQITSDRPGQKCSICGMDLVLIESDEDEMDHSSHEHGSTMEKGSDSEKLDQDQKDESIDSSAQSSSDNLNQHSSIKLSLRKQQMIGVKLFTVKKQKLFKSISAPGRIAFDPELYTAQGEYLEALKQWNRVKDSPLEEVRRNTREMIHSSKIRLKILGLSEDQIRKLGSTRNQNENLLIAEKGETNWVYADVFEMDLPYIEKDLAVEVSASYLQGKTLPGKVISVDRVINPETRTAKIRIQLLKESQLIRPESYVNVNILVPLGEHLSVPTETIMHTGKETLLFVKKDDKGRFEPRKVRVSLQNDEFVAISSGLKEGEEVVVGGNFMIDSESRLKAVLKKAVSGSSDHQH